jgi:hypothetical protein
LYPPTKVTAISDTPPTFWQITFTGLELPCWVLQIPSLCGFGLATPAILELNAKSGSGASRTNFGKNDAESSQAALCEYKKKRTLQSTSWREKLEEDATNNTSNQVVVMMRGEFPH